VEPSPTKTIKKKKERAGSSEDDVEILPYRKEGVRCDPGRKQLEMHVPPLCSTGNVGEEKGTGSRATFARGDSKKGVTWGKKSVHTEWPKAKGRRKKRRRHRTGCQEPPCCRSNGGGHGSKKVRKCGSPSSMKVSKRKEGAEGTGRHQRRKGPNGRYGRGGLERAKYHERE